jgi:hypothetical protein
MKVTTRSSLSGDNCSNASDAAIKTCLSLIMLLTLLAGCSSVRAGGLASASKVPGPWGQISHNFQMSISAPINNFSDGQPIVLKVYLRNLGPEFIFATNDLPVEYQLLCRPGPADDRCIRRPGMLGAHNIGHGGFDLHKNEIYGTSINISDMYDIKPGTYQMQLEFPLIPTGVQGLAQNSHPIARLISNAISVTVLK